MDTKKIVAIVAVIIVVAAAAAAIMVTSNHKESTKPINDGYVFEVDTVAAVYGNANMDDKIDSSDVTFVKNIIDNKTTWNKSDSPYADANNDGVIDSKDVDQINMIINNSSGKVWYKNYYGETQEIQFPLTGKKIGVTYWQQAQLVDLLGHWGDVVAANASVTDARSNQYDLSKVTYAYGTTGSSKLTEEFCEGYAKAGVDLIIGSPYKTTVTDVAKQYLPNVPVITLGIGGSSCVSSALTLGILMNANEQAQTYEKYVVDAIKTIKDRLSTIKDEDKPSMLVCRMYADNKAYIEKYGGILVNCANTDGSYQLLSMFANLYTDNSEKSTTPARTTEWILSQKFDLIFDMEVYTGFQKSDKYTSEQFYTQDEYNDRFENSLEYFKNTSAYGKGGILSSSYIFDGYSGFASLMMSAYMIYPNLFTCEEGQNSLQYWYDTFTNVDVDVTTQGGYIYTGISYTPQFKSGSTADLHLLSDSITPTLYVCGNVNGDLVIDENDKTVLQKAITDGTTDKFKLGDVNLGDANNDSKVDSNDVDYIQKIIDATIDNPVTVKHLNRMNTGDYWTTSSYPIEAFASTGSANIIMMYKLLGVKDQIKGVSYSGGIDASLYPEYQYLFTDKTSASKWAPSTNVDPYRLGNSATYMSKELLANHINDDKITAVIVSDNKTYLNGYNPTGKSYDYYKYATTEKEVKEDLHLSVIRVAPAAVNSTDYLSDLALLAFFLQVDNKVVSELATWTSATIKDLNSTLTAHVGIDVTQVSAAASSSSSYKKSGDTETSSSYISSGDSDYTQVLTSAGAKFAMANMDFKGQTSYCETNEFGVWLNGYKIDKVVCIRTGNGYSWYGGTALTDGKSTLSGYMNAFKDSEVYYNDEIYAISGDMPVILRVVYAANILYPTLFSDEWANSINADFCEKFFGMTQEQISKGVFHVSMEDLGL